MSDLKLTNGFRRMSIAKLLAKARLIHQQMSTNSSVFVSPKPTMAALLEAIDELTAADTAAANGDRTLIARKNTVKEALVVLMHNLGNYVTFVAEGNYDIAVLSGYTVAKLPSPITIYPPQNLRLTNGEQRGWIDVAVDPIYGSGSFIFQYSTDPDKGWESEECCACTCTIENLTVGTLYYFRVGVIGKRNQKFYGEVLSRCAA